MLRSGLGFPPEQLLWVSCPAAKSTTVLHSEVAMSHSTEPRSCWCRAAPIAASSSEAVSAVLEGVGHCFQDFFFAVKSTGRTELLCVAEGLCPAALPMSSASSFLARSHVRHCFTRQRTLEQTHPSKLLSKLQIIV